ncbi:MAG: hypothetical protein ACO4AI_14465 [Prochlorothrix sp.]|nr:hypothetical protein [Prochlorothrix sp.]
MILSFRGQRYEATTLAYPYLTIAKYRGNLQIVRHDPAIAACATPPRLTYRGCVRCVAPPAPKPSAPACALRPLLSYGNGSTP